MRPAFACDWAARSGCSPAACGHRPERAELSAFRRKPIRRSAGALCGRRGDERRARRQRVGEADPRRGKGTVVVDANGVRERATRGTGIGTIGLVDDEVGLLRVGDRPDRCQRDEGKGCGEAGRARAWCAGAGPWGTVRRGPETHWAPSTRRPQATPSSERGRQTPPGGNRRATVVGVAFYVDARKRTPLPSGVAVPGSEPLGRRAPRHRPKTRSSMQAASIRFIALPLARASAGAARETGRIRSERLTE